MTGRALREQRGQALVVTVLFLTVLLGCAGLVIDVGAWYVKKQQAQAAADFGALAAAAELPGASSSAVAAGESYAGRNLPGGTPTVTPNFGGDDRKAEVKVRAPAPTFFLKLFGFDSMTVSARAVARKTAGGVPLAIFAYQSSCSDLGVRYNGERMNITGGMHSNGSFSVNGNNNHAASATAGGPNKCKPVINGANITFGGQPKPAEDYVLRDWPVFYRQSDFRCDFVKDEFIFNKTNEVIPSGVYCASKLFKANGNNQSGTITVLAPEIVVDGNNQRFRPYAPNKVLFFATGTKELILNGYAYDWEGVIFHPNGRVKLNGDSYSVLNGLIEGLTVEINGAGFSMNGTGYSGTEEISLVE